MDDKLIRKTRKYLRWPANLLDYDKLYKGFSWEKAEKELSWFKGRRLNAAYNAIDRNVLSYRKNKVALYWLGKDGQKKKFTFAELAVLSNQFAHLLKSFGVKKGERVFFFLPRVPELYYGFLGVLKTGAIAGTLFSAFGPRALFDRLDSSGAKVLVTNKELKTRVNKVKNRLKDLEQIILVEDLSRLLERQDREFRVSETKPTDPAFMLYTSGTTGKPKGVVHLHQAILYEYMTAKWVLDLREDDVYWVTADPGWVTGIGYGILGNWSNGASTVVYEGRFSPEKWYQIIQDYKVTVWYTAPTAIRMLAAAGKKLVKQFNLSSLRHLASVGEPLNPEAVYWGLKAFGLPFHDNYWQTETGGIVIANYPCMPLKPGSMGKPVPGVKVAIVDKRGRKLGLNKVGSLALKPGWPGMMAKIWRRPRKYQSYFLPAGRQGKNGWYITGDLAYKDKDGYFWFVGRADDVIKTAGERVGPFEVESALVEHPAVVEAGVIGKPDPIRGEIIKAFIALKPKYKGSEELKKKIAAFVKKHLAGHAYPREIKFVGKLPKTRSGKIMRRYLKAKELGLPTGDVSTLEEY